MTYPCSASPRGAGSSKHSHHSSDKGVQGSPLGHGEDALRRPHPALSAMPRSLPSRGERGSRKPPCRSANCESSQRGPITMKLKCRLVALPPSSPVSTLNLLLSSPLITALSRLLP